MAACVISGLLLGLLLAIPVAVLFLWLIFRRGEPVPFEVQARNRRLVITGLSVLGIFVAGYLTWSHYSGEPVYCGGSNSCELVNSSRFAYLGPLPVALIGLTGYIIILVLSLIPSEGRSPVAHVVDLWRGADRRDAAMVSVLHRSRRAARHLLLVCHLADAHHADLPVGLPAARTRPEEAEADRALE